MDKDDKRSCNNQTPKNIKVNTQVRPEDFEPVKCPDDNVCWDEVEDATVLVNPDVDSMESRG